MKSYNNTRKKIFPYQVKHIWVTHVLWYTIATTFVYLYFRILSLFRICKIHQFRKLNGIVFGHFLKIQSKWKSIHIPVYVKSNVKDVLSCGKFKSRRYAVWCIEMILRTCWSHYSHPHWWKCFTVFGCTFSIMLPNFIED